jgi:hypothetical protein
MVWPTGAEWDARNIAKEIRQHVSESELTTYLTTCERDIQSGILSPTNCVPAWLNRHRRHGPGAYLQGTNLEISVLWLDRHRVGGVRIGSNPKAHVTHDESTRVIQVHTNCTVWVTIGN